MLKIIDLLKGQTVIPEIDDHFVETQLLKYIAVEYEEDLPEIFWLSPEAVESLLTEDRERDELDHEYPEEEESLFDEEDELDDEMDTLDPYVAELPDETISEELKSVVKILAEYLRNNSVFIDSDANNKEDLNERGCYLVFERIKEDAEYKVYGSVKKNDALLHGFRLELYDDELLNDEFLGFGFTDANGNYKIEFNREDFSKDPLDFKGIPTLYLDIAELDKAAGEFKTVKRFNIPSTDEKEILYDINL